MSNISPTILKYLMEFVYECVCVRMLLIDKKVKWQLFEEIYTTVLKDMLLSGIYIKSKIVKFYSPMY